MFDMQTFKPRSDHAVCSVETGLHMIKAIKDVRAKTQVVSALHQYLWKVNYPLTLNLTLSLTPVVVRSETVFVFVNLLTFFVFDFPHRQTAV